jgi:uncharacterized protein YjdB
MNVRIAKLFVLVLVFTVASFSFGNWRAFAQEEISKLVLNKNDISLEVGNTSALTATAVYVSGSTENVTIKTDWNSGAADIASIYAGSITAKKEGTATITATYSGETVIVNVTVTKHVKSLVKDKQTIDLRSGKTQQISLTAYYDDGTSEDVTQKATWTTDSNDIATVVNGLVTGQSSGSTIVTAKFNNTSVSIPVNIETVRRVDAAKSQVSLLLNASETVQLNATYPDGTVEDVTDKAVWESDSESVADAIKGKITGYGPGQATIKATYGTKSAEIQVDVDNAIKLDLDRELILMKKNATDQLILTATYPDAKTEDISDRAQWTSSDDKVIYVTKGKISANATGEATITAKYGDKTVTAVIDVDVPRRLGLDREYISLQTGKSDQLTLTATYADGKDGDVTAQADWSVDNNAIADVIKGKITAYKPGEVTVTATYGGKSISAKIAVDIPNTITPDKKMVNLQEGGFETIGLRAIYADGHEESITSKAVWTTSAADVAEVRDGTITGVSTGTATITAKYATRSTTIKVSVGIVKSLTATPTTASLKKGDKQTILLNALYTDGTTKEVSKEAEWTSTNVKVASVDGGVVTAIASGETTITAAFGDQKATIAVDVDLASTLRFNIPSLLTDLGENTQITLFSKDSAGVEKDVTSQAEWTTSSDKLIQVTSGLVTPVSRGKATLTAKYGGKSISLPIEIGIAQSLDVNKKFVSMKTGESVQIQLTSTLSDGSKKDVTADAEWKSSAYKLVDVRVGLITSLSSGSAKITATFGGKSVSIPVDIDQLKYLKTDVVTVNLKQGETTNVKATATYMDGVDEDVSISGLWGSTNIRIADVKDGIIKATGKGRATVTVTFAKMKTTVLVIVQ